MREPEAGTTLGRCTFCKDFIIEGNGNRAKHATVQSGHWLCGDCVIGMKDVVFEALMDYTETANKQNLGLFSSLISKESTTQLYSSFSLSYLSLYS